jgi:hypothetical protein
LLAVLVAGFSWPGWFRSHNPKTLTTNTGTPATPAPTEGSSLASPVEMPDTPSLLKPKPVQELTPSAADLSQLESRLDLTPCYILVPISPGGDELPQIPELETMLKVIVKSLSPYGQAELIIQTNKMELSNAASGEPLRLTGDIERKSLQCSSLSGVKFQIDFLRWNSDAKHKDRIVLRAVDLSLAECASILFKPLAGSESFPQFRLVLIKPGAHPEPVQLSKSFLNMDKSDFENSLGVDLRKRVMKLKPLNTGYGFQLRLFQVTEEGANARSLFDRWPMTDDRPPKNGELQFAAIRRKLSATMNQFETTHIPVNLNNLTKSKNTLNEHHQKDFELGRILFGLKDHQSLYSFARFISEKKRAGDRANFVKYLHEILKRTRAEKLNMPDSLLQQLDDPKTQEEALKQLHGVLSKTGKEKEIEELSPDAFLKKWQELEQSDDVAKREGEKRELEQTIETLERFRIINHKRVGELRKQLDELPTDLSDRTTQVRLFIGGPQPPPVELIRFTESPK